MTCSGLQTSSVRLAANTLLEQQRRDEQNGTAQLASAASPELRRNNSNREEDSEGFDRSISLYWNWLRATRAACRLGRGLQHTDGGLILQCEHWLEAADAKHRYGTNLRPYFDFWLNQHKSSAQQQHRQQQQQQQQQDGLGPQSAAQAVNQADGSTSVAADSAGMCPPAPPGSCSATGDGVFLTEADIFAASPSTAAGGAPAASSPCPSHVLHTEAADTSSPASCHAPAAVLPLVEPPQLTLVAVAAAVPAAADTDTGQRTPRRTASAPRLADLDQRQHVQLPPPKQQQQQQGLNRPPSKYGLRSLPLQTEARFFYWLDEGDGRHVDLAAIGVPRTKLESERVTYLTPEEREQLQVVVGPGTGLLQYRATGELVDTGADLGMVTSAVGQQPEEQEQEEHGETWCISPAAALCVLQQNQQQQQQQGPPSTPTQAGDQEGSSWVQLRPQQLAVLTPLSTGQPPAGVSLQKAATSPPALLASCSPAVGVGMVHPAGGTPTHMPTASCCSTGERHGAVPGGSPCAAAPVANPAVAAVAATPPAGLTPDPPPASSVIKDTIREKPCKWIYVLDTQRRLFVHAKFRGKFHHSSFVEGGAVLAAGGIVVQRGRVLKLTADSGHYRPSFESFMLTVQLLKDMGADLTETKLSAKHIKCPQLPAL